MDQYTYTLTLTNDTGTPTNKTAECCFASFTISTDSVSSYSVQVSGAGVSSPVMAGISEFAQSHKLSLWSVQPNHVEFVIHVCVCVCVCV